MKLKIKQKTENSNLKFPNKKKLGRNLLFNQIKKSYRNLKKSKNKKEIIKKKAHNDIRRKRKIKVFF